MPVNPDFDTVREDVSLSASGNVLDNDSVLGGVLMVRRDGVTYVPGAVVYGASCPAAGRP